MNMLQFSNTSDGDPGVPHLSFEDINISHACSQHMQLTPHVSKADLEHSDLVEPVATACTASATDGPQAPAQLP